MGFLSRIKQFVHRNSIFGWILLVSLVPFLVITTLAIRATSNALYHEITDNLSFIANQKANDIENYIISNKDNATVLAKDPIIAKATQLLVNPNQNESNELIADKDLTYYLSNFLQRYNLSDIFIVSPSGKIVFSLKQPQLVNQDYSSPALKNTPLGQVIDNAKTLLESALSDFLPVKSFSGLQLYIASPIVDQQQRLYGVLVLQMDNSNIEKVVRDTNGLGNTGETLVGMVTDNKIVPTSGLRHVSLDQFTQEYDPLIHTELTGAMKNATLGKKGVGELVDYRGEKVLAAWQYLPSMRWGMLVKIDQIEAFKSINDFKRTISFLGVITFLLALLLALSVARKLQAAEDELKRLLVEVEQARKDASDANLAKSAFLANMSHELRTPLNAITGYSEMLMEDAADQQMDGFVEDLQKINGAGQHLLGLINDILDISKIEAGRMELYMEDAQVELILNEIASLVTPLVQKKKNTFTVNAAPNLGVVHTDVTKLRQCLLNLISNASKFTENGVITLTVDNYKQNDSEYLRFKLSDTGIGMSKEQLSKIFHAFTQADISTTRKFGGTGLGLYLTQRFTKMLGGEISVVSELGKGSEFCLMLPKRKEVQEELETPILEPHTHTAPLATVLIIDDDKEFHQQMEEYLSNDFRFLHAYTGETGIKMAQEKAPNVIALDIIMPGIDGWSVLKTLRSDPATSLIPIIITSMSTDKELGYTLGVADYLVKPIEPIALLSKLHRCVGENKRNVLVVEDDINTRKLMVKMLQKAGIGVSEAENGKVALEKVEKEKPSAILLDLMMPIMNGFEVVEHLRKDPRWMDIPIIVITAKDLTESERAQLNNALVTVMRKGGYQRKNLIKTIHTQIQKSLSETKQIIKALADSPLPPRTEKMVLIIDENNSVYDNLHEMLKASHYRVMHAEDSDEGLRLAIEQKPDVIALDIIMRTSDGLDVLTKLRSHKETHTIPIIVMSKMSSEKLAYMRGVREYLVKPVEPTQLLSKIKEHIGYLDKVSILLVDDDANIRTLYKKLLSPTGWNISEAANGKEAIAQIQQSIPTLILLDLTMPEMDGFEVVERLVENPEWRKIEVIILTAKDLTKEEMERLTASAAKVFQKATHNNSEILQEIHLALSLANNKKAT